jgi:Flp pilus assembly protein TadD
VVGLGVRWRLMSVGSNQADVASAMKESGVTISAGRRSNSIEPVGGPYDWFQRAAALLAQGNPDAAAQLLERVLDAEPGSQAALESLGRARFDARRYDEAAQAFAKLVECAPDNDYAHFGLGLCYWHRQHFVEARDHLALAFVMRPSRSEYSRALSQVKATLLARATGDLPLNGPMLQ